MFVPLKLPNSSAPSQLKIDIDTFLGADLTNSTANVSENRSPDCQNMIRDVPGKVRKRTGYCTIKTYDAPINAYHVLNGKNELLHVGTKLYKGNEVLYENMANTRSRSWEFDKKLYIADGKALLVYDGEKVKKAQEDAYEPTVKIACAPNGAGEEYEGLNLLQSTYTQQYLTTAADKNYQLSFAPLDEQKVKAQKLKADGTWEDLTEGVHFSVNRTTGMVTFLAAIGVSPVSGQDNLKITAAKTVEGNADKINKCTIGIQFGVNGANDRLFLAGNPDNVNYDWFSEFNNPSYWCDLSYSVLGQSDSAIIGYTIVNARLAAHKDGQDFGRNIIVREGNLQDSKAAFKIMNILQGEGAIAPFSFAYMATEPVFLTRLGVYAITAQDITGEKYSQCRSFYLNGLLLKEPNLENAFAFVFKDMYWLCLNNKAYILDGLQANRATNGEPYSTRQYVGFYCTNIPANVMWQTNGELFFGTTNGEVCKFYSHSDMLTSYNDNGAPIYACWRTPDFAGRTIYRNKAFSRFYVELKSAAATSIRALVRVSGIWGELFADEISARYFTYSKFTYSKFTYSNDDTPRTLGEKIRVKKVDKSGFKVENGTLNEPFGLNNLSLEFVEAGYYKNN